MSLLKGLVIAGATILVSELAFSKGSRKELMIRDKWTCQNESCFGYYFNLGALDWHRGYMVQAAHYPDMHRPGVEDRNIDNGRCLCSTCHLIEHIAKGDIKESMMLYEKQTIRNKEWLGENGWKDEKMPFRFYYDWAFADERGRLGLAQAYAEKWWGDVDIQMSF